MKIIPEKFKNFNRVRASVIVPRPISFVSSVTVASTVNLSPFSSFNVVAYSPTTKVIGISRQANWKSKDTLANIEATGAFVINILLDEIAEAMEMAAAEYSSEVHEFEIAGLTPYPSDLVKPPMVGESPVNMECLLNK